MSSSESVSPSGATTGGDNPARLSAWMAVGVLIVRLRFLLVLLAVVLLVGAWPTLRRYGERLTGAGPGQPRGMAADTEFWCPMCPGVVSDWPGKCPVCNMALVRRKKGEAVPLPDGVLARMQFSPYRVQLAGIRTAVVEYQPLRREVVMVGPIEKPEAGGSGVRVRAEVFDKDLPFLAEGQAVEAASDLLPGHLPFHGKVGKVETDLAAGRRSFRVRLDLADPERELRPGTLVTVRTEAPITRLDWWRRVLADEWRNRTAADLAAHALLAPAGPAVPGGLRSLLDAAGTCMMHSEGLGLAVPRSAVIDHGSRKVAFVESGPGMFDAVEVTVGPRCGDLYPVLRGLEAGQRVAAAGAFLLDAEMWLNHNLAATYFGATRGGGPATPSASPSPALAHLSAEERVLVEKQKVCPVTGEPLDSMGGPVRVDVAGRTVFICCKGCEAALRKDPAKYLAKLPPK